MRLNAPRPPGLTSIAGGHVAAVCYRVVKPRGAWAPNKRVILHQAAASTSAARTSGSPLDLSSKIQTLQSWLGARTQTAQGLLLPKRFKAGTGERTALIAADDVQAKQAILTIPEDAAVTALDAQKHETVGEIAKECSELVALTLWLMAEKAKGESSPWHGLLQSLPDTVDTPILWTDSEVTELLAGSPVQAEARARRETLKTQWRTLAQEKLVGPDFPPDVFNEANFLNSFCVLVASTTYLPSAELFALLPLVSLMGRTGNDNGCDVDFDASRGVVVVSSNRPYRAGQEVALNDPRPNGELLLATGMLQDNNASDFLMFNAELLAADKYFMMKEQILDQMNMSAKELFPVFKDRFPNQLLAYVRLSRIQDPALFAKVSFEKDIILSQMNEYEVLQLLMGDCRERLQGYTYTLEEELKVVQGGGALKPRELLAARLRFCEKQILSATMDALRKKLAPIRGIPTKTGKMQDPNSDIREVFELIESIPAAPAKLLGGFLSWARGEDDPDWGGKGGKKDQR